MHNLDVDKNENNTKCELYQDYFSEEEEIDEEEIPLSGRVFLSHQLHHEVIIFTLTQIFFGYVLENQAIR
jgi:hypothetical protein